MVSPKNLLPLKEYLLSLSFSRAKDRRAPLVVEAVIYATSIEDAKRQVEENDVDSLKWIYYGHSHREDFKPNRQGTEGDFENFLGIAVGYKVRLRTGKDRRDKA